MSADAANPSIVAIQPAALDLAPALAAIHAECFGPACWSVDQMRGSLRLVTTQGWLAKVEEEPAGFLLCQRSGGESEILTFCVRPKLRGNGLGERLLRVMLNALPPGGASHLEVAADNDAARRLYEKCGYVEVNTRKGYYRRETGLIDAVCYRFETAKKPADLPA
ncbi:MAG: N-acetyltransferase [Alphaproteobacteria bacterium]|nr:N-acetyltransferase [Alphaproteobacteria bacterium]